MMPVLSANEEGIKSKSSRPMLQRPEAGHEVEQGVD
jgi:hypothetical protein